MKSLSSLITQIFYKIKNGLFLALTYVNIYKNDFNEHNALIKKMIIYLIRLKGIFFHQITSSLCTVQ